MHLVETALEILNFDLFQDWQYSVYYFWECWAAALSCTSQSAM